MKRRTISKLLLLVLLLAAMVVATSCESFEAMDAFMSQFRGDLIGNSYQISEFDDFGNRVFTVHGDKVSLSSDINSEGEIETSYMDITIDGHEWNHVGGTLIFMQDGADMITDFQIPDDMSTDSSSSGLMSVDRFINNYENLIGRSVVVIVYSQMGVPIGMFQGDNVYTKVPDDLYKTTMVSIDGKLVYVHKANIDIIPANMIK